MIKVVNSCETCEFRYNNDDDFTCATCKHSYPDNYVPISLYTTLIHYTPEEMAAYFKRILHSDLTVDQILMVLMEPANVDIIKDAERKADEERDTTL